MNLGSTDGEKGAGQRELVFKTLRKCDIDDAVILETALRIVEQAERRGILLRLLGAAAFAVHCPSGRHLFARLSRKLTDIDVATYGRFRSSDLEQALAEIGFERQRHYLWHAASREIYASADGLVVDVFRDALSFSHEIRFEGRLELDRPTVPLEELLLGKLQIHRITEKDLKDILILLLEHDLGGRGDRERIDDGFLSRALSDDWGFYRDAVDNLSKAKGFLVEISGLLAAAEVERAAGRIDALVEALEKAPKTARWRRRSRKGTKKAWYREVGELQRGF